MLRSCLRIARNPRVGQFPFCRNATLPSYRHFAASSSGDDPNALKADVDAYGSVSFVVDESAAYDTFQSKLKHSVSSWRAAGRCGIWAKVPNNAAKVIPALLDEGFDWHHARSGQGYSMLTLWLQDDESRFPSYGGHQVGVGGLVLSPSGDVLLMKEKVPHFGRKESLWKLPGGLADLGEDLGAAAAREVVEETGVQAVAEGLLSVHHRHGFRFGVSDFYFAVQMRAESSELKPDPREVLDLTWMPLEEVASSPAVMDFNKQIIALAGQQLLVPHWGSHGSIRGDHFFYKAALPE